MSKGSNTTTQTQNTSGSVSPSDPAMAAYMGLLQRAQGVSNTPFAPYQGSEVAPINETQLYGLNTGQQAAAGLGQYASNAGGYMNDAGQWVQASDIDKYMDPYTQSVINATQKDFDVQNQRAASATAGNAASIGALGGNSTAVAKALTQEGQERVQAPVMASLHSTGFQSAEQMANSQKNRELQAGQVLSGADLAAAQQQFAFGTQQQQTTQAQDTQQMTDYYMQQGYPFATAQWLAGITLGTGPQMGSTSTGTGTQVTQGPQPNQFLQGAGLGLTALAAFSDERLKEDVKEIGRLHDGQKIYRYRFKGDPQVHVGMLSQEVEKHHPEAVHNISGFGAVDYDRATADAVKKWSGGSVRGFAPGGAPIGGTPYGAAGAGWVPTISLPSAAPMQASLPRFSDPKVGDPNKDAMGQIGKGLGSLKSLGPGISEGFGKIGSGISDFLGMGSGAGTAFDPSGYGFYPSGADGLSGMASEGGSLFAYNTGGSVPVSSGFAGGIELPRRGYQSRGAVPLVNDDDTIDATDLGPVNVGGAWDRGAADASQDLAANDVVGPGDASTPVKTVSYTRPSSGFAPEPTSANPLAGGSPPVAPDKSPAMPGGPASPVEPQSSGFGFRMSDEARQGLISMGLAMMGNRVGGKGSFLAGVGDAGAQGMNTYGQARTATLQQELLKRKEALENLKQQQLEQHRRALEQHQQGMLDRMNLRPTGTQTEDGVPILYDTRSGNMFANGKPLTADDKIIDPKKKTNQPDPFTSTPPAEPTPAPTPAPAPPAPAKPQEGTPQATQPQATPASFTTDPTKPISDEQEEKMLDRAVERQNKTQEFVRENVHEPGTHPEVLEDVKKNLGPLGAGLAAEIKAVSEGRQKLSSVGSRTVEFQGQKYSRRDLVERGLHLYNGNWYEGTASTIADTMRDLSPKGTTGKLVLGVDQLLPHLKTASDAVVALDNGNWPTGNTLRQWLMQNKGDPRVQKFNTVRDVAALDAARILRGAGAFSESEVEHWRNNIKAAGSPAQLHGVLNMLASDLMAARVNSIRNLYRVNVGKDAPDLLSPEAKEALSVIKKRDEDAQAKYGGNNSNLPVGATRMFNANGELVQGVWNGTEWVPKKMPKAKDEKI